MPAVIRWFSSSKSKKSLTESGGSKPQEGIRTAGGPKNVYNYDKKKDLLGSGNFAEVYKGTLKVANRTVGGETFPAGMVIALKVIDMSKVEDKNDIEREIEIMTAVQHKNVIRLFEVFEESKFTTLVMELVQGGELFDRIVAKGSYTEKDAANCIFQVCDALEFLHEKKIVHRDLKPENILYANAAPDETIKIADFGLARSLAAKGDMMKTACGTPGYVAPEILANKGYDKTAVDMWSVGVILYILLCGFPPFYEEELPALFDSILKARYDFPSPFWDNISAGAKDLVRGLLNVTRHPLAPPPRAVPHALSPCALCTAPLCPAAPHLAPCLRQGAQSDLAPPLTPLWLGVCAYDSSMWTSV